MSYLTMLVVLTIWQQGPGLGGLYCIGHCRSNLQQLQYSGPARKLPKGAISHEVVPYGPLINVSVRNCSQLNYCTIFCLFSFLLFFPSFPFFLLVSILPFFSLLLTSYCTAQDLVTYRLHLLRSSLCQALS